jgi:hypothetical protein
LAIYTDSDVCFSRSAVFLICFSLSFAKFGVAMYILDVQDRVATRMGKWLLLGAVGLNVSYLTTE